MDIDQLRKDAAARAAQIAEQNSNLETSENTENTATEEIGINENKRYYCRLAHSRFVFSNGSEIQFFHGFVDIGPDVEPYKSGKSKLWKTHQQELDAILGKQSNIFTQSHIPVLEPAVNQNARSESEISTQDQTLINSGFKTQIINSPTGAGTSGAPTDPNASTLDPALRDAMGLLGGAMQSASGV